MSTSAPCSFKTRTDSRLPWQQASYTGVKPLSFRRLGSAPAARSILIAQSCFLQLATYNKELPPYKLADDNYAIKAFWSSLFIDSLWMLLNKLCQSRDILIDNRGGYGRKIVHFGKNYIKPVILLSKTE